MISVRPKRIQTSLGETLVFGQTASKMFHDALAFGDFLMTFDAFGRRSVNAFGRRLVNVFSPCQH